MKLYHRTPWQKAKKILTNGFLPTTEKKERVECGYGIYCVCSLEDANKSYNKKHYGNGIVEITVPDNLQWEKSTKVDFMRRTKLGDNKKNRIYDNHCTNGTVAVLWNTDSIQQLRISKDNGMTWHSINSDNAKGINENMMGKKILINEVQEKKLLREYLDNEYGKPIYDYLKNGNRYSSEGHIHDSKKLVLPFYYYLSNEINPSDVQEFKKGVKQHPKLKDRIKVDFKNHIHCYSKMRNGYEEVNNYKFWKENQASLYQIFCYDPLFSQLWERFWLFLNSPKGTYFLKSNNCLDADVAFMNPTLVKPQWLVHFTDKKDNALSICKNGFANGVPMNKINQMAYSKKVQDIDRNGKIAYAYNALEVTDDIFPAHTFNKSVWEFDNNFDQYAWQLGYFFIVMFVGSGVEAFHHTDGQNQVMFNADTARDFVLLSFSWDTQTKPHEKDTRNVAKRLEGTLKWCVNTVDGKTIYSNASATKAIRWVINNFDQYRDKICWSHKSIKESVKKINLTEEQENLLLRENIKIHKGENGRKYSTQGKWDKEIECPHCSGKAYFSMSISDGEKGRGRIKVTNENGEEENSEVQTIALYYCPKCYKFIARNNMA